MDHQLPRNPKVLPLYCWLLAYVRGIPVSFCFGLTLLTSTLRQRFRAPFLECTEGQRPGFGQPTLVVKGSPGCHDPQPYVKHVGAIPRPLLPRSDSPWFHFRPRFRSLRARLRPTKQMKKAGMDARTAKRPETAAVGVEPETHGVKPGPVV